MWYAIFADNLVRETNPDMVASVLLDIVETTPDEKIRKFALFLLGYHNTPEHINRIMPHLTNETTAGATIRTLGKWQATNAVPQIIPFLTSTNERKRILAVNALHDIGDTNAIPALTPLTNDTLFTVRENVDRALDKLNSPAGN
jgi:HEAT repeat protein